MKLVFTMLHFFKRIQILLSYLKWAWDFSMSVKLDVDWQVFQVKVFLFVKKIFVWTEALHNITFLLLKMDNAARFVYIVAQKEKVHCDFIISAQIMIDCFKPFTTLKSIFGSSVCLATWPLSNFHKYMWIASELINVLEIRSLLHQCIQSLEHDVLDWKWSV